MRILVVDDEKDALEEIDDYCESLIEADHLIVDQFEKTVAYNYYAERRFYEIIDRRFEQDSPTFFIANCLMSELQEAHGAALLDRAIGLTRGKLLIFSGQSRRYNHRTA